MDLRLTRPAMLPQQIGDFKTEATREWIGAESLNRLGSRIRSSFD
jgi:hypothetical protein